MISRFIRSTRKVRYLIFGFIFHRLRHPLDLRKYRNIHKDKPMLIVGNGPSLNKTPLDRFSDIPSIGMNKINLIFKKTNWRPSYIACINGLVIKQNKDFFVQTKIPIFLGFKAWFQLGGKGKHLNYLLESPSRDFIFDIEKLGVGSSGTVTFTALQLAYYMGASPIIIVGVDHNFNVSGNNKDKMNDIVKMDTSDVNHFDPDYFAKGKYWGLPNLPLSEKGYLKAKEAFESDGKKIYDATVGGKLDIFEKIDIDEAIRICGKN